MEKSGNFPSKNPENPVDIFDRACALNKRSSFLPAIQGLSSNCCHHLMKQNMLHENRNVSCRTGTKLSLVQWCHLWVNFQTCLLCILIKCPDHVMLRFSLSKQRLCFEQCEASLFSSRLLYSNLNNLELVHLVKSSIED